MCGSTLYITQTGTISSSTVFKATRYLPSAANSTYNIWYMSGSSYQTTVSLASASSGNLNAYFKLKAPDPGTLYSGFWSNSIQQIRSIPAFDRWRSGKRVIFAIFEGGVIMLQEKYAKLDDLAAPNCYVAPPTSEDLSYVVHFRQICKRYNIDFSSADSDEKNFVMKMAEKSFMPKRA